VGKFKDLTGMTFGRWTVISKDLIKTTKSTKTKNGRTYWICECDCNGEKSTKSVRSDMLISGTSKSCGCLQKELASKKYLLDLTGKRFNRWLVVGRGANTKFGEPRWKCICNCRNKREVLGSSLRNGVSQSCGCLNKEINSAKSLIDMVGLQFNRWTVIKQQGRDTEGGVKWLCRCSCDLHTERVVKGNGLRSGNSKSCGCLHREIVSEVNLGEKNSNWKGGVTLLSKQVRYLPEYKNWYKEVFERDNYTCRYSGEKGRLSCHHIKPFHTILEENNITTKEQALDCKELWDISNGITLLFDYHSQTSKNPLSFHKVHGTYSTAEDFYEWFDGSKLLGGN